MFFTSHSVLVPSSEIRGHAITLDASVKVAADEDEEHPNADVPEPLTPEWLRHLPTTINSTAKML